MNVPLKRTEEVGFVKELADMLREKLPQMYQTVPESDMPFKVVEVYRRGVRIYDFRVSQWDDFSKDYEFVYGLQIDRDLAGAIDYKRALQ